MKPHPSIYKALLERSALEAAEVLHVGDDPENDVEAPMALGMHGIWLNRNGHDWPTARRGPCHQVRDLHELAAWLDRPC
jgi:putative hydrolase of the HAD superfamily